MTHVRNPKAGILGLFVLLLMFTASDALLADCGWILWRKSTTIFEGGVATQQIPVWAPQDGFDQLEACRGAGSGVLRALAEELRKLPGVSSASIHPGGRSATIADSPSSEKRVWELEFVCFPGGFDPRSPSARQ